MIRRNEFNHYGRKYINESQESAAIHTMVRARKFGDEETLPANIIKEYKDHFMYFTPADSHNRFSQTLSRLYHSKAGASYLRDFLLLSLQNHSFEGSHSLKYYQDEKPGFVSFSTIASKIRCNYIVFRMQSQNLNVSATI